MAVVVINTISINQNKLNSMREQALQPEQEQPFGLSLRILHIKTIRSRKRIDSLSLQVQHIRRSEEAAELISSCSTQAVAKQQPIWMEDVYYNNNHSRDRLELTLFGNEHQRFQDVIVPVSHFQRLRAKGAQRCQVMQLDFNNWLDCQVRVDIEVAVYENHDFLTGIRPPQLSLAGLKQPPPRPAYNAIDLRPSRLNCFSCMDEVVEGFDHVEFYPGKFKGINRKKP